jgi:ubiquinone/menaquinone biosynthesis C-methylase UbiE
MSQTAHAMLPHSSHDELARQQFVSSMRKMFTTELFPGIRELYERKKRPEFTARAGRDPANAAEVEDLLKESFYYRGANAFGRTAQELVWDVVGESIDRQIDALNDTARPKPGDLGTLRTDPDLPMPRYIQAVDIHAMPGNFHTELSPDDTFAGALYDRGVYFFSFGGLGDSNDAYGGAVCDMLKTRFPDLKPRRILDVGCGIGSLTLPLKDAFPDAEVYGIDIGAPMVRYAHGRAESLGRAIHFSQQDARHTDFPDGYFDVIASIIVTHEAPAPALRAMFKEAHRLLAPGGVMMHDGSFAKVDAKPIDALLGNWFAHNANEPFSVGFKRMDFADAFVEAGFAKEYLFSGSRPPVYLKGQLPDIQFIGAVRT